MSRPAVINWAVNHPTWGTAAADKTVAHKAALSEAFSNLTYALNGTISASNFQTLLQTFYDRDDEDWLDRSIAESKIRFDPSDGHDHAAGDRDHWTDHKIEKKNLDRRSARVVWTSLEGIPTQNIPHGLTVLGGIHTFSMSLTCLITPPAVHSQLWGHTLWYNSTNFVKWANAWYWKSTNYTNTAGWNTTQYLQYSPFAPGVQPVLLANMVIGGNPLPFLRLGRGIFQQQLLGNPAANCPANLNMGFWVWWEGWNVTSGALGGDHSLDSNSPITLHIPWLAFGPGGAGWVDQW